MSELPKKITLDDPALRDRTRLQTQPRPITYSPRSVATTLSATAAPSVVNDIMPVVSPKPVASQPASIPEPVEPADPIEPVAPFTQKIPQLPVPAPTAGLVQLSEPDQDTPQKSGGLRSRKLSVALTLLAVIAFGTGIFIGVNSLRTNRYVSAQLSNLRKVNDPNAPAEDQPSDSDLNSYQVPGNDPRILSISKIGVKTRIRKLGVKADNELAAPNNIFDVGWYEGSSRPDEYGAMLIDGHVQGPTKPGVFINLDKLKANDQLTVERGDGQTFTYHVVKTQTFDSSNMDMRVTLNSIDPDKKGLNIISCTGQYDTKTKNYKERLVVFAVQD